MTAKKNPTVEELEQKLAASKTSKVRLDILSSLMSSYGNEIDQKYDPQISNAEATRRSFKVPNQKSDVEKIVAAIEKAVGTKYRLTEKVVCKVAHGNNLTFELEPNLEIYPDIAKATRTEKDLHALKAATKTRLGVWKRKQMFNIANGKDFEEFKV